MGKHEFIREVTVFTNGDSSKVSAWSNVPYFFTKALLAHGIRVNRVDLSPSPTLKGIYDRTMRRLLARCARNTTREYFRSWLHFRDVRRRIRRSLDEFQNADANIFLTFSFSSAGLTRKPTVLFCDWTYEHYFHYFLSRRPDRLEALCIRREDAQIERSNLVVSLFPTVAEMMKQRYRNPNILYLGNVVNSLVDAPPDELMPEKMRSNSLLFVGSAKYLEGATALIDAFASLRATSPDLTLDIIGMDAAKFNVLPEGVRCHGYLDKGDAQQCEQFYQLLRKAKVFINTTPRWGAFSATLEALWFHTPIVVSPYSDFVATFGEAIDFGSYCETNQPQRIAECVRSILASPDYPALCANAHRAVHDFTWNSYITKLLDQIGAHVAREGQAVGTSASRHSS